MNCPGGLLSVGLWHRVAGVVASDRRRWTPVTGISRSNCGSVRSMSNAPDLLAAAIAAARAALDGVNPRQPEAALPHLREAQVHLSEALDEAMAAAVLTEGATLRQAGTLAGLTENAVGPRLARTSLLAAYRQGDRVTRAGVERARYDLEEGRHKTVPPTAEQQQPLRFRARRQGPPPDRG